MMTASATAVAAVVIASLPGAAGAAQAGATQPSNGATQLIVGYRAGAPQANSDEVAANSVQTSNRANEPKVTFQHRMGTGSAVVTVDSTDKQRVDAAINRLKSDPAVEYVENDGTMYATAADPNDPEFKKQWDLNDKKAGMNVPPAWDNSTGKDVVVAVIDTGYVKHSELESKIVGGYDFISKADRARDGDGRDANPADEGDWNGDGECGSTSKARDSSWHGTHVAGTIAATTNNNAGIAGIATEAKIEPVRVLGKCGGSTSDISDAIVWASGGSVPSVPANPNPAKVINMSLGGAGLCSTTTQRAIDGAVQRGTTVVVAAGNDNKDAGMFNPANCNNVVTVAASNRDGAKAFYSNFGDSVDVTAPGGQTRNETDPPGSVTTPDNAILSTVNAGKQTPTQESYKPMMGTSMAAPHIAGLVALILGKNPKLTPAQIEDLLKKNARPLPGPCPGGCGAGLADAGKTVAAS